MTDEEYLKLNFREIDWLSMPDEEIDRVLQLRVDHYERAIAERGGKRPKREGYVMERLALMDNIRAADHNAQTGHTKNRAIRRHNKHANRNHRAFQKMLLDFSLFPEAHYDFIRKMTDAGKIRDIAKQHYFPWHILHHDIMLVTGDRLYGSLIMDTFACIKGKGLHFGVQRVKKFIRLHPECKWYWKTDFKKYYQSIPHEVIRDGLEKLIKDETFIRLVELTLFSYVSTSEIDDLLEEERERKKRSADWCLYKPTSRQLRTKQDRPSHERGSEGGRLLSLQRRHDRVRKNERGSQAANESLHPPQ